MSDFQAACFFAWSSICATLSRRAPDAEWEWIRAFRLSAFHLSWGFLTNQALSHPCNHDCHVSHMLLLTWGDVFACVQHYNFLWKRKPPPNSPHPRPSTLPPSLFFCSLCFFPNTTSHIQRCEKGDLRLRLQKFSDVWVRENFLNAFTLSPKLCITGDYSCTDYSCTDSTSSRDVITAADSLWWHRGDVISLFADEGPDMIK